MPDNFRKTSPIAVLEQPSPGRMTDQTLGRRNIVLPHSGELNTTPKTAGECSRVDSIVNAPTVTTRPGGEFLRPSATELG